MLMDRILGAFMFRREVYADVEQDTSFTQTAWLIVAVIAFLSALGGAGSLLRTNFIGWLLSAAIGTGFAVLGFAVAAWVMSFVGRTFFQAQVTFDEVVRTVGLAYVWNILGLLGILGGLSAALTCLIAPIQLIGALLGFAASLVALKEALDLDWLQVFITVLVGWIVIFLIQLVAGIILAAVGLGAAGIASLF